VVDAVVDIDTAGASPTACANDKPGATDTIAPGREAADHASCAVTVRVTEPLLSGDGALSSACACAGAAG